MPLMYLRAHSPLRVGTGQGVGVIDLPIIREELTGWPYIPGSSLKGVLRDACRDDEIDPAAIQTIFGPETSKADEHAGGVRFPDMHLVGFPVRALTGGFVWITCEYALLRWAENGANVVVPDFDLTDDTCLVPHDPVSRVIHSNRIVTEDLEFMPRASEQATTLAQALATACFAEDRWRDYFLTHVAIVTDSVFGYLNRTAVEIIARNRLEPNLKTVAKGALWWEEAVPTESLFAASIEPTAQGLRRVDGQADRLFGPLAAVAASPRQIGAGETIGRGIVSVRLAV